jgi:DNA (cytosine-5)-methyltransferase 1
MNSKKKAQTFTYIDLFSGCGGLSLGVESAGGVLEFAVEKSEMAAETFFFNLVRPGSTSGDWNEHLALPLIDQMDRGLVVNDVNELLGNRLSVAKLKKLEVDLVAGGPPCQGFSMAGRRKSNDSRNSLPWKFLEVVSESNPKIVIIENVLGMNHKFSTQGSKSESTFSQLSTALEMCGKGYVVQKLLLNAKHFGAAQDRPRLFLIGYRKDLASKANIVASTGIWKSDFKDKIASKPDLAPAPTISEKEVRTVAHALQDFIHSRSTNKYLSELKDSDFWGLNGSQKLENFNFRNHGPRATTKFEIYLQIKTLGLSPLLLRDGLSDSNTLLKNAEMNKLKKIKYPLYRRNGELLASTANDFAKLIDQHKTKKHSQRVLDLSSPSPTVITSPDDYIHPIYPRVLSVRELARFQGFPDAFTFRAKETTGGIKRRTEVPQYSQVGNAVSPFVSRSLGLLVSGLLKVK